MPLHTLIGANLDSLAQARDLLGRLDDRQYGEVVCAPAVATVGVHIRHVLEYYSGFFAGLPAAVIDYDNRMRNQQLERNRTMALQVIAQHDQKFQQLKRPDVSCNTELSIRLQATSQPQFEHQTVSTIGRELVFLQGHATHHFAQVAMHMRAMGLSIDQQFGKAPSTITHEKALPGS